ncbi:MAG: SCP2 domain-containing protein [Pararhodobacter sp.]
MQPAAPVLPHAPRPLAVVAARLPLAPISALLSALCRDLDKRHPSLRRRLGIHGERRFALELSDLPLALLLEPTARRVTAHRPGQLPAHDARISGTLSAFLGMVHGRFDADALFFSRDLSIDGDTEAALALRNAIDDAELDLGAELLARIEALPPGLPPGLHTALSHAIGLAERLTGLALTRPSHLAETR